MSHRWSGDLARWRNRTLVDRHGEKIGTIADVYVDESTQQPVWVLVHTGMFGTRETIVPVGKAQSRGVDIWVPYDKSFVKEAPHVAGDQILAPGQESALSDYYRLAEAPYADMSTEHRAAIISGDAAEVIDLSARRRSPGQPHTDT